jgi:hypothetical protein
MDMTEEWRAIPGYEGTHEVSSLGRVRALARIDAAGHRRREKVLGQRTISRSGHQAVVLYRGAERRDALVHHLVLAAFVGARPDGLEGCHYDDDPTNNNLRNLRWDTRSANQLDSVRNGTHHWASRTHCAHGHEFSPENTYRYPSGGRSCITCRRASWQRKAVA